MHLRLTIIALILTSFALVAAEDDPYGVSAPKTDTTLKTVPKAETKTETKAEPKIADTSKTVKSAEPIVNDTVAVKKKTFKASKAAAKKDSVLAQKKAVKDSSVAAKAAQPAKLDTTVKVGKDSARVAVRDTTKHADTAVVKSDTAKTDTTAARKPRQRIVRETTINTLNEMKGKYRSPKQALFLSLIIPGLGQAYVGQTKFNYVRAAAYFSADIVLGAFWYDYVVVKHDREVRNYHRFADTYWNQTRYEDSITQHSDVNVFAALNPARETYCNAVVPGGAVTELAGCKTPSSPNYSIAFLPLVHAHDYSGLPVEEAADSTAAYRASFPNTFDFYGIIAQEQEFISGWSDASDVIYSGADTTITGTSAKRDQYIAMRAQANRYARMQAWFLGGIVLNHIASALDAALTARFHNRSLYETESMWYDRVHFDGGLAFEQGWPKTNFSASLSF